MLDPFEVSPDTPTGDRRDIFRRLERAVGDILTSDNFRRYLDVQSRFHHYSWGNVALILAQRPDATRVAGYRSWLKLHRFVKRGEHGITIIVPMHSRRVRQGEPSDEERDHLFFGTATVFDVSQTEGEPLPTVAVPVLDGDDGGLYAKLAAYGKAQDVTVCSVRPEAMGAAMGCYVPSTREIIVKQAAPAQMAKTLAHELAHYLAQSTSSDPESETIAESVAYVVCAHFGLDTGARSFPYVARWSRDQAVFKKALTRIQTVSARMIDGVEGKTSGEAIPVR